jgi:hypothetical protein
MDFQISVQRSRLFCKVFRQDACQSGLLDARYRLPWIGSKETLSDGIGRHFSPNQVNVCFGKRTFWKTKAKSKQGSNIG